MCTCPPRQHLSWALALAENATTSTFSHIVVESASTSSSRNHNTARCCRFNIKRHAITHLNHQDTNARACFSGHAEQTKNRYTYYINHINNQPAQRHRDTLREDDGGAAAVAAVVAVARQGVQMSRTRVHVPHDLSERMAWWWHLVVSARSWLCEDSPPRRETTTKPQKATQTHRQRVARWKWILRVFCQYLTLIVRCFQLMLLISHRMKSFVIHAYRPNVMYEMCFTATARAFLSVRWEWIVVCWSPSHHRSGSGFCSRRLGAWETFNSEWLDVKSAVRRLSGLMKC